ncbi:MAG: class I SAM-dependent methyltransferase, partial [Deltaproteobacteria bacterium]
RICRSLLLAFMRIRNAPSFRLLDLCHGPGWGLEAVAGRFPLVRMTALDFTDAFSARARERVGLAGGGSPGPAGPVVTWVGPDRWKGFGHPLPFGDGTFDAVFFSCGDPYIPAAQRGAVYREIARILAPGATLGILTRCRPDADRRHVPSFRIRVSALVHDFAESVCEGWEGFPSAEENIRLFSELGFAGERSVLGSMSLLESSLWVLRKAGADA